jgi:hypothetical protein
MLDIVFIFCLHIWAEIVGTTRPGATVLDGDAIEDDRNNHSHPPGNTAC